MTKELDPIIPQRIVKLAEAYPDYWEEIIGGRTESRSWILGMAAFGLDEAFDRKTAQAWIDEQVRVIRHLDREAAKEPKMLGTYSRMPIVSRVRGVPEAAPVEDVLAKAVVEGTEAEVIDFTRTQILPDGSLSIVTTPVDLDDTEEWVTLDLKGPPIETTAPTITAGVDFVQGQLYDPAKPPRMEITFVANYPGGRRRAFSHRTLSPILDDDDHQVINGMRVGSPEAILHSMEQAYRGIEPIAMEAGANVQLYKAKICLEYAMEHFESLMRATPTAIWLTAEQTDEIAKEIGSMDLRPGGMFELPDTGIVGFEHLGAFLFGILKVDLDDTSVTDPAIVAASEASVARLVDDAIFKFRNGQRRMPDEDVEAYRKALEFQPD